MATVRWAHPVGTARWVTRGEAPSSDHRTKPRKAKPQAQISATGTAKPRNGRSPTPRPPDEAGGGGRAEVASPIGLCPMGDAGRSPKLRPPERERRSLATGEAPSSDHRTKPEGERAEVRYAALTRTTRHGRAETGGARQRGERSPRNGRSPNSDHRARPGGREGATKSVTPATPSRIDCAQ